MDNNNEIVEQFESECLFLIDIEHLNHISPYHKFSDNNVESTSDKYLAVLDRRDRLFLGIKRYFKSYGRGKCVPTNREINADALSIFGQFHDEKNIYRLTWKISEERNQFFVVYLGVKAITYCDDIDWNLNEFHSERLKLLHERFIDLKDNQKEKFEKFLSDFCGNKKIYFSASNSYDLQLPRPEFNMGITDPDEVDKTESIHLAQDYWSRSGMWFPIALDFKGNLMEFIMITFTLSEITIERSMYIPVLLDLEGYDLRRRSLERKKNLLEKVALAYAEGVRHLNDKSDKELTYFDLLHPTRLIRVRSLKNENDQFKYGEFTHFFSKDKDDERKLSDLMTVINYSSSERAQYEKERSEEFNQVSGLIISYLQSKLNSNLTTD